MRPLTISGLVPRARTAGALALVALLGSACHGKEATGPKFDFAYNPCQPSATVQLAVAATLRLDCSNGGTTVTFEGGGASYLIVPSFATDLAPFQLVNYSMASGMLSPNPVASVVAGRQAAGQAVAGVLPAPRPMAAQRSADRLMRTRGRQLAASAAFRAHLAQMRLAAPGAVQLATPAAGSIRTFQVISTIAGTPAWATVNARLTFVGANVLLYVDTLAPGGGVDSTQAATYGQYFDGTLFGIDTTAFGGPTDIDQNGHVIMLMTPVVNGLVSKATCTSQGFVAGFFSEEDFAGPTDPHSNQGEIFYTIVPDSAGLFSCAHSLAELQSVVPATFLHELQHLIGFGTHVVVSGGAPGAGWLDEGLSIVAEELGSLYYEQKCPPPSCRTNPAQLFPDSSQGFIQNFLYDSYQFAYLPDTASITLENDGDLGSSWRGGAWLLARWLGDQYGVAALRQLERGPSGGAADIAQVAGRPFADVFADFSLAVYTDSLPGLPRTTAPAANRYVTRNLSLLWGRLFTLSGPSAAFPLPMPVRLFAITRDTSTAVLYPGTVTYFRLDTPAGSPTVSIRFAAPGGAAFPASLAPQIAVFRLPPGQ